MTVFSAPPTPEQLSRSSMGSLIESFMLALAPVAPIRQAVAFPSSRCKDYAGSRAETVRNVTTSLVSPRPTSGTLDKMSVLRYWVFLVSTATTSAGRLLRRDKRPSKSSREGLLFSSSSVPFLASLSRGKDGRPRPRSLYLVPFHLTDENAPLRRNVSRRTRIPRQRLIGVAFDACS